jgi:hypothetical protein
MTQPEDTALPNENPDQAAADQAAAEAAAWAEKAAADKAAADQAAADQATADQAAADRVTAAKLQEAADLAAAKEAATAAEARAKLLAESDAAAKAAADAAQSLAFHAAIRTQNPLRFSAPNLIGGRVFGLDVGDRLQITDSLANDGVHIVARVEGGWLVTRGEIHDEPPTPHATIGYVTKETAA